MEYVPTEEEQQQGSPAWHALRRTKITASNIAILMGCGKYDIKTPRQLYMKKKGLLPETTVNPAMRKGVELEPVIRAWAEKATDLVFTPRVVCDGCMMASLDGLSLGETTALECKYVSAAAVDSLLEWDPIPAHHYWQLIGQFLACSNIHGIFYVAYDGTRFVKRLTERTDVDTDIERARAVVLDFYNNYLLPGIMPPATDKDREEVFGTAAIDVADKLCALLDEQDELVANIEATRSQLIELTGERNVDVGGLRLTVVPGRQTIDYKAILAENPIDTEPYIKQGKQYITIKRVK